jgi:putative AlgH/UPF0301 family transcriptional regulator
MSGRFPYTTANSWLMCDATDDLLFNYHGIQQWKEAVEFASMQTVDSWL